MSPTSISAAPLGRTQVRSGWTPSIARRRASAGSGRALGQQLGGERAGGLALARAGGPVEQVGVRRRAVGRERRGQDRAGVGVAIDDLEHGARPGYCHAPHGGGRLIAVEGIDGAGKTTLADGLAAALPDVGRAARAGRRGAVGADPRAGQATRRWTSTRAPRRCCTRRRGRSWSPSGCCRCWRRARRACWTASSTPRWPTRARGAGWASRRSPSSTVRDRRAWPPT